MFVLLYDPGGGGGVVSSCSSFFFKKKGNYKIFDLEDTKEIIGNQS